jgi:hypothetical protein
MIRKSLAAVATCMTLLAGCSDKSSQETAPVGGSTTAVHPAGEGASNAFERDKPVTAKDFVAPGVTLTVNPNPYSSCDFPKGHAVVSVGFDARPAGAKHVQIWIQGANAKATLWGQAPGFSPAHPTGNWINDGSRLVLVDLGANNILAITTVHAAPCQ